MCITVKPPHSTNHRVLCLQYHPRTYDIVCRSLKHELCISPNIASKHFWSFFVTLTDLFRADNPELKVYIEDAVRLVLAARPEKPLELIDEYLQR